MNLAQFKEQFESDTYKRCKKQEKTIRDLHDRIKKLNGQLQAEQKKTMALENRCFAQTLGALCNRCEYRSTCQAQLKHMQKITFASPGM